MGEVLRLAQGWRWLPLLLNPSRWNGRSVEPLVWAVLISGAGGYFLPGALSPITMVTAETGDGGAARAVAIVGQASVIDGDTIERSEEHTSELQSLMRISYAVFCLKKKTTR